MLGYVSFVALMFLPGSTQEGQYRDLACIRDGEAFPAGWVMRQSDRESYSCLDPRRNVSARPRVWSLIEFPLDGGGPHVQPPPVLVQSTSVSSTIPLAEATRSGSGGTQTGARSYAEDLSQRRLQDRNVVSRSQILTTSEDAQRLRQAVDAVIHLDSRSWIMNRYDVGSVGEVAITRVADHELARAPYTYNGGMPGWIAIQFSGEDIRCIEYHDFAGSCRPIGQNPARAMVVMGVVGLAGAAMLSSESGSSRETTYDQCMSSGNFGGGREGNMDAHDACRRYRQ